jgi:hypothetical protein
MSKFKIASEDFFLRVHVISCNYPAFLISSGGVSFKVFASEP